MEVLYVYMYILIEYSSNMHLCIFHNHGDFCIFKKNEIRIRIRICITFYQKMKLYITLSRSLCKT